VISLSCGIVCWDREVLSSRREILREHRRILPLHREAASPHRDALSSHREDLSARRGDLSSAPAGPCPRLAERSARDDGTSLLFPVLSEPPQARSFLPDVLSEAQEIRRALGGITTSSRMLRDFCRAELCTVVERRTIATYRIIAVILSEAKDPTGSLQTNRLPIVGSFSRYAASG
jgi:hypothetical protein